MQSIRKSCQLHLQNTCTSGPHLTLKLPPSWSNPRLPTPPSHSPHGGWQWPLNLFPQAQRVPVRSYSIVKPSSRLRPFRGSLLTQKKTQVLTFGPHLPPFLVGSPCSSHTDLFTVPQTCQARPISGPRHLLFPDPGTLFPCVCPRLPPSVLSGLYPPNDKNSQTLLYLSFST